ncbi:imidazole glycerol phosphate synthase, glutamine amidotransferase subunit H [Sulfurimonas gotlandica GD1]|uniref:Imidazole glycerol phosphate synthase subunit HisH n=1 Tax=Sulfurimonas gotlandica (strain DSM 19862 / JCM 16533 / GD1) TaxID=929558 RepID=B6BGE1_SULGG|nr:imidazole glycerol phosphate synthase subunit HisH [Sulfurimonas gotlandica]EDZ63326.1 imidazole glycerol phosphate synthase, glutamine amidotransferase subunit [Sulfurimonas gotlandica GD1]EHP29568.1 imidazole glycerol phosphate synthase, glutamine amidotransferase subunit H [Sulfurimonas gotlandica GD1]
MLNITILDYGLGNIRSLKNAFEHLGVACTLSKDRTTILNSDALILPGVGAFSHAMNILNKDNLVDVIREFADSNKPLLGICLGMQLLFKESEEFGKSDGLGLIDGSVVKLSNCKKLPHVGWQTLENQMDTQGTILQDINKNSEFYFVHSFVVGINNAYTLSSSSYGNALFSSCVKKENIYGCQFHPEKSAKAGLKILNNFIEITKRFKNG